MIHKNQSNSLILKNKNLIMKKIIAFILIIQSIFAFSQVKWMTIEEALEAQKTGPTRCMPQRLTEHPR